SDDLRIASLRADNTDLEHTRERGKGEPFAIGRPIRLGGVGGEVGWDAPGRAARSGDGEQAGGAALARNVANGLSVGRPAGRRLRFPGERELFQAASVSIADVKVRAATLAQNHGQAVTVG